MEERVARDSRKDKASVVTMPFEKRRAADRRFLPTLRVVSGPDMFKFCSILPHERIIIGRDESCDLTLTDVSVSREHAVVSCMGSLLMIEDMQSTNGTSVQGQPVRSACPVPLGEDIQVGSVTLRVEALGSEEITHLTRVRERLNQADRDPLTGLLSRRHLDEVLPKLVAQYLAAGIPISAIFGDVDRFKEINDRLGHAMGDEVLRTIARVLSIEIRDTDMAIRYGGEEFVLILPNCDEGGAAVIGERIRARVARHDWSAHLPGSGLQEVTLSLGVAEFPGGAVRDWIAQADMAMYKAKRQGRNKICRSSRT
jgi:two-component system, cell cycle response regulator